MPAARLFFLLGGATVLLAGAVADLRLAFAVLLIDTALVGAFTVDLVRARRTSLSASRRWPTMLVQGASGEVAVEIVNPGGRDLELRLREALDPALAGQPLRSALTLPAGRQSRWRYRLSPRRRGTPICGPLDARLLGPWKLAWSQRRLIEPEEVRVYPQVRWEGRVGQLLTLAQRRQLGATPLSVQGMGSELYALRGYLPGDPMSRIHWKASARHARLVTREETWERGARLTVLLDTSRTMTGREEDRSKLDYALAASLALARVAVARGDRVTVLAFSDRVERQVRLAGPRDVARAYGALFDLAARRSEPAYDLAAEAALGVEARSATVVLFTSVVDLAAAELLREALLRLETRHRPMLVNLQDPELEGLARDEPATPAEAFAQASALEIQLANRDLSRRLRRAGVRVVNSPADRLALETLEAYLALFRSRLLRRAG